MILLTSAGVAPMPADLPSGSATRLRLGAIGVGLNVWWGWGGGAGQEVRSKMVVVSYMCHVAWHMGCARDVGVRKAANLRKHEKPWEPIQT